LVFDVSLCHTPFFDPVFSFFTPDFKPGFFVISDEISAEKYFKIPHFGSEGDSFFSFISVLIYLSHF